MYSIRVSIYPSNENQRPVRESNSSDTSNSTSDEANSLDRHSTERKIDILLDDNEELRKTLMARCEKIVLKMIEQLCIGILPKISCRITTIVTLMEQIDTIDPYPISSQESCDSTSSSAAESSGFVDYSQTSDTSEKLTEQRNTIDFGSHHSQKKFALIMTTLAKVHRLLANNRTQTRRSFYYELKGNEETSKLAISQGQIDQIVNTLANLLECSPWDMGLVASAKGLGSGPLTLTLGNGEKIDYRTPGGTLIPQIVSNVKSIMSTAEFILVVEKEAVFQRLLNENCPRVLNCVMITGKGYPDVATRLLVKILAEKLELPVYILVDADPYGFEIMLTYKYGSINLSYECGNLACYTARWIGLLPSELVALKIPLIKLTQSDISKLDVVQSRPYLTKKMAAELSIMRLGKAEIEAITGGNDERELTTAYLWDKIQYADYI